MKHGFFSVKTILVTLLLKTHGVFHLLLTESFIFIQNSKIFKEMLTTFLVLVKKTIKYLCYCPYSGISILHVHALILRI